MRVEPALLPPAEKLFAALDQTDERLLLSAAREPAILLRDKKLTAEDMLSAAVPMMEKVNALLFGPGAHQAD